MNLHDATEQAYKNGYEQGLKDAVKHGRWSPKKTILYGVIYELECSVCGIDWALAEYRFCPNCGARMDLPEPYNPDIPRDQWQDKARFE